MRRLILAIVGFALVLVGCSKNNPISEGPVLTILCVTENASSINLSSATLNGSASIKGATAKSGEVYFYFSGTKGDIATLKTHGEKVPAGNISTDGGDFNVTVSNLVSSKTYYYVAAVCIDKKEELGKVKSFTTEKKPVAVTGEYSDLVANAVTVYGWCNQYITAGESVTYGIEYSSTDLTTDATSVKGASKDSDNRFSCKLSGLQPSTKYYYRAYVLFKGVRTYGDVNTFQTPDLQASITADASYVGCETATISGKLTIDSEGIFTKSGTVYYSSKDNSLHYLKLRGTQREISFNEDGTYIIGSDSFDLQTTYYYCAVVKVDDVEFVSKVNSFTTQYYHQPDVVDLGLSVKWASFNIGATRPEECGFYYQWSGIKDVTRLSINLGNLNGWPYHEGLDPATGWTKYVPSTQPRQSFSGSPDNKMVLELEDDVAHIRLGGRWRMPTKEECEELINNCTWTYVTQNGVDGYKVASNKPGYTSKSIFLPAAGYRQSNILNFGHGWGNYWSSSLSKNNASIAYHIGINGDVRVDFSERCSFGFSVRPVLE